MKRIFTGLVLGGGWLLVLLKGSLFHFWLVIMAAGIIALYEYGRMVLPGRRPGELAWSIFFGITPLVGAYGGTLSGVAAGLFLATLFLVAYTLLNYRGVGQGLDFLARTLLGYVYISFCLAHLILLRAQPQGAYWLLALTALTIGSDTGGYYAGRLFGRTKLCPAISPGKTVAGAIGGLVLGGVAGAGLIFSLFPELDRLLVTGSALILVCIGVMGDLVESVLKRSAGIKDSGTLLAGHGGLLDRGDSLLLAAPVLLYLLHFGGLAQF